MPKVDAPEALGYAQSVAKGVTLITIQPIPIIETVRVDHQRIVLPLAHRITQPGGLRIRGKRTAIGEDLAEYIRGFVENRYQSRQLKDLKGMVSHVDSRHGRWHAMRVGVVLAILLFAFLGQSRRPGLNGEVFRPEVGGDVLKLSAVVGLVDPGQVRFAVGRSRHGRREIRLTVAQPWDPRGLVVQPLCRRRHYGEDEECERSSKHGTSLGSMSIMAYLEQRLRAAVAPNPQFEKVVSGCAVVQSLSAERNVLSHRRNPILIEARDGPMNL